MLDAYDELIVTEADDAASRDHRHRLRGDDLSAPHNALAAGTTDPDRAAPPPDGPGPAPVALLEAVVAVLLQIEANSRLRTPDLPSLQPLIPTSLMLLAPAGERP